ncbi:MAG: LPS-assembly protein LptD [Deltaproteobacteria bacterium ADurb.Bin510]|nr:MAG: LPS-assembly protein LptD [Deltaproteobacteria bacterium ADurb.Bin510]
MRRLRLISLSLASSLLLAGPLLAAPQAAKPTARPAARLAATPADKILDITANRLDASSGRGEAIFKGAVVAKKGDMVLTSESLKVVFDLKTKKVSRVIATGKVHITQPGRDVRCQQTDYNIVTEVMILTGSVVIRDTVKDQLLSGNRVIYDRKNDRQVVEGQDQSGRGRVKFRIQTDEESGILEWKK